MIDNINNRPSAKDVGEDPIARAARGILNTRLSRRGTFRLAAGASAGTLLAAAGVPALPTYARPVEQAVAELPVVKISEAGLDTDFTPATSKGESWSRAATLNIPSHPETRAKETDKLHEFTLEGPGHRGVNIRLNAGQQDKIHAAGGATVIHFENLPLNSQIIAMDAHNQRPVVIENGQETWAAFGVTDLPDDFVANIRVIPSNPNQPVKVSLKAFSEQDVKNPKSLVVKDLTNAFPAQVETPVAPIPAAIAPQAAPAPAASEAPREPVELPRLKFEQAKPGADYFFARDAKGNDFNGSAVFRIPFAGMTVRSSQKGIGIVEFVTDQRSQSLAVELITDPTYIWHNAMSDGKEVPGNLPALYFRTQPGARVSLVDPDGSGRELLGAVANEKREVVMILPTSYAADIRVRATIANPTVSTLHELAMGPLTPEWRAQTVVIDANQVADRIRTQFTYR